MTSLADAIPSAVNIEVYARIVREKSILRRLINLTTEIASKSYQFSGEVEDILDQAEKSIFEITDSKITPHIYPLSEVIKDSFQTIERCTNAKSQRGSHRLHQIGSNDLRIPTFGPDHHRRPPQHGQDGLGPGYCPQCLRRSEVPAVIFSLEMSRQQLAIRLLCSEARVDSNKVRTGFFGESEWSKLTAAAGTLSEAPIFIDDSPTMTVLQMRAKARRLKSEKNLGLIVIDYLQLMKGREGMERREQEISEISRSLKALAKELNIPVIALSQLNRRPEGRDDKKPVLADLRESGAIEQDADVICFIFREEMYEENSKQKGIAEILLRKHRNGPTGSVSLTFLDAYTRFENLASGIEEPY